MADFDSKMMDFLCQLISPEKEKEKEKDKDKDKNVDIFSILLDSIAKNLSDEQQKKQQSPHFIKPGQRYNPSLYSEPSSQPPPQHQHQHQPQSPPPPPPRFMKPMVDVLPPVNGNDLDLFSDPSIFVKSQNEYTIAQLVKQNRKLQEMLKK